MNYRPEIDGLRALAVLPVMLFHAGFETFSGGFVGVDVFFVISGYLITSIILLERAAGTFSLRSFYERRARRILPALFLVMAICVPFAWLWLLPDDLKDFSQSLVAVSLLSSNILFSHQSGYFDAASELKPLLHTWSLAVEEQYYVLFPLFIILAWQLGRRWMVGLLGMIAVVSFTAAQLGEFSAPAATFFLLPTRGWELAIGAFIAFYFVRPRQLELSAPLRQTASAVGLMMILYPIFMFSRGTPFSSFYALIPTIGAALIIMFATPATIVGAALGSKVVVGLGLISYSAYLWHQPLLVFYRHSSLMEPRASILLLLCFAAIVLAYFSWRFVELPFRQKVAFSRQHILIFSVIGSLFFIAIGYFGYVKNGFPSRFGKFQQVLDQQFHRNALKDMCKQNDDDEHIANVCVLGSTKSEIVPSIAVFGDSHANALNPVFDFLGKAHSKSYAYVGLGGCPPLIGIDVLLGNHALGICDELSRRQYEYVKNRTIKKVVLLARWSLYTDGEYGREMSRYFLVKNDRGPLTRQNSRSVFVEGIMDTVDAYEKIGVDVFIIFQIPQQQTNPRKVYLRIYQLNKNGSEEAGVAVRNVSVSVNKHLSLQQFNRGVFEAALLGRKDKAINLDAHFCDSERCILGNSTQSYYRDSDHLNSIGALRTASALEGIFR